MAKIQSSFINMLMVLTGITLIAGAALGYVYEITKAPIAQKEMQQQEEAIRMVMPDFDNSPVAEQDTVKEGDGSISIVFPIKKEGKWIGSAVQSESTGFGGKIRLMVGFNADGSINNYRVLGHSETPGLGSKMEEWFRTEASSAETPQMESATGGFLHPDRWFFRNNSGVKRQSVIGKKPATDNLSVSKDGGDIDAITAATISSRAFLNTLQRAYNAFRGGVNTSSGATTQSNQ